MKISQLQPFRHSCHGPCCDTGRLSSASHREGPSSIPDQFMWDLWWIKWHWDWSLYEYFFFPMSVAPVLQTHEFIHHRRHMILANIFVKQYTKKVLIFLIHISYVFFGRLEPFDFRDLNSVACVVPCMSSCCVCGSESCFISFFVSFTHNIWNI